jgi:hypothetical protein
MLRVLVGLHGEVLQIALLHSSGFDKLDQAALGVALTPAAAPDTALPEVKADAASERESKGYQGGNTRIGKTPQLPQEIL